jgi:hypothetical protein
MKKFSRQAYLSQKAKVTETFEVTLPSGVEFTLRRPNLQAFFSAGLLPTSLVTKLIKAFQTKTANNPADLSDLSVEESVGMLIFQGEVLKQCCFNPRLVAEPKEDDEIGFSDLADDDILAILEWAMSAHSGGVEGENASRFHSKPKQRSKASASR